MKVAAFYFGMPSVRRGKLDVPFCQALATSSTSVQAPAQDKQPLQQLRPRSSGFSFYIGH